MALASLRPSPEAVVNPVAKLLLLLLPPTPSSLLPAPAKRLLLLLPVARAALALLLVREPLALTAAAPVLLLATLAASLPPLRAPVPLVDLLVSRRSYLIVNLNRMLTIDRCSPYHYGCHALSSRKSLSGAGVVNVNWLMIVSNIPCWFLSIFGQASVFSEETRSDFPISFCMLMWYIYGWHVSLDGENNEATLK